MNFYRKVEMSEKRPNLRLIKQAGENPPPPERSEGEREKPKLQLLKSDGERPNEPESEPTPDYIALRDWSAWHESRLDVTHALEAKRNLFSLGTASRLDLDVAAAKAKELFRIDQYSDEDLIVWINRVTTAELQKRPGYFFALINEIFRRAQVKS